jgi:hypothetical protein
MKVRKVSSCALLILPGLPALAVHAQVSEQPPVECRERNNLMRVWINAYQRGQKAVDHAFRKVRRDCERSDEFHAELIDRLEHWIPRGNGNRTPACIAHGLTSGVYAALAELEDDCFGICIRDGQAIGELSGSLYCQLSVALGGLGEIDLPTPEPPASLCDQRSQAACQGTFTNVSLAQSECLPFTEDDFETVFEQTRADQCAF